MIKAIYQGFNKSNFHLDQFRLGNLKLCIPKKKRIKTFLKSEAQNTLV